MILGEPPGPTVATPQPSAMSTASVLSPAGAQTCIRWLVGDIKPMVCTMCALSANTPNPLYVGYVAIVRKCRLLVWRGHRKTRSGTSRGHGNPSAFRAGASMHGGHEGALSTCKTYDNRRNR